MIQYKYIYIYIAYLFVDEKAFDFVEANIVLNHFGDTTLHAKRAFDRFVASAALENDDFGICEVKPGIGGDWAFDTDQLNHLEKRPRGKRRAAIATFASRVSLIMDVDLNHMKGPSRSQKLVMARRLLSTAAYLGAERQMTEIASFLSRDKGQISRLVSQGMDLLDENEAFRALFEQVCPHCQWGK